jgi:anti-anti-sigma regulatory factor
MSAMSNSPRITVARFDRGYCLRIEGAGTMSESPVMHAFAERVLSGPEGDVVVDLGACTYVDSTFLGGLVSLFKRHGSRSPDRPERFVIYAPAATRQNLFGTSRLDRVFPFVDQLPLTGVECLPLDAQTTATREELGHYIVECHRRLAELGGPEAEAFGRVADALADELTVRRRQ